MEVNILDYAAYRILSIEYEDKRQKLVVFLSKFLNKKVFHEGAEIEQKTSIIGVISVKI